MTEAVPAGPSSDYQLASLVAFSSLRSRRFAGEGVGYGWYESMESGNYLGVSATWRQILNTPSNMRLRRTHRSSTSRQGPVAISPLTPPANGSQHWRGFITRP